MTESAPTPIAPPSLATVIVLRLVLFTGAILWLLGVAGVTLLLWSMQGGIVGGATGDYAEGISAPPESSIWTVVPPILLFGLLPALAIASLMRTIGPSKPVTPPTQ